VAGGRSEALKHRATQGGLGHDRSWALFGLHAKSDMSPECAQKRTSVDQSELMGFGYDRLEQAQKALSALPTARPRGIFPTGYPQLL
jgi:hypothetical protein